MLKPSTYLILLTVICYGQCGLTDDKSERLSFLQTVSVRDSKLSLFRFVNIFPVSIISSFFVGE